MRSPGAIPFTGILTMLIQPWAKLIALGEKQFEARSRRLAYRGASGIHAR